jgi:hypothetical protein
MNFPEIDSQEFMEMLALTPGSPQWRRRTNTFVSLASRLAEADELAMA